MRLIERMEELERKVLQLEKDVETLKAARAQTGEKAETKPRAPRAKKTTGE